MTIPSGVAGDIVTHVALSSLERSALQVALFAPASIASIRGGARLNLVDADDSGTLKHVVALGDYLDALWRAVAPAIVQASARASATVTLANLYAFRAVPDPQQRACFIALTPAELEAALEADYPDALDRRDAIGARIHSMYQLRWFNDIVAFLPPDTLSQSGWRAAAQQIDQPEGPCWAPELLLRRRSLFHDPKLDRASALIREIEASLGIPCEAPFGGGQDFQAYRAGLFSQVMADPCALGILHDDGDRQFAVVTDALEAAGHDWRNAGPIILPAAIAA
ncbi:hypothetical protein PX699_22005 [Sphingobium sp. H39-3-25]|uniref:hypothetical protein n=1 Tax=Sphingobium arseniciresistens TaxID=3030834 RepID=UPI0023B9E683|nr:hypothetical protein [Sphingobium arseniciresistens]|tara:strand:+ start:39762 stop:40604 length:843 start_codon:yes stop_codon:yes gene_type:complete